MWFLYLDPPESSLLNSLALSNPVRQMINLGSPQQRQPAHPAAMVVGPV